jgi:hypothetical protein
MAEGAWQLADDLKSKIFPKTEGGSVGRNDKVELHRPKTETPELHADNVLPSLARSRDLGQRGRP